MGFKHIINRYSQTKMRFVKASVAQAISIAAFTEAGVCVFDGMFSGEYDGTKTYFPFESVTVRKSS